MYIPSRAPFPLCTMPVTGKPLLITMPMCLQILFPLYEMPIPPEISPLIFRIQMSPPLEKIPSFLFSSCSHYILIISKPLLCTSSSPASPPPHMELLNPLRLTPTLRIISILSGVSWVYNPHLREDAVGLHDLSRGSKGDVGIRGYEIPI